MRKLDEVGAAGSFLVLPAITHAIHVVHVPGAGAAARATSSGYRYSWQYATAVCSLMNEIRITEFPSFVQADQGWTLATATGKPYGPRCFVQADHGWTLATATGKPYGPRCFADGYGCPDALLKPGRTYICKNNGWGGDQLRTLRVLWSFVGVNEGGVRVRGEARRGEARRGEARRGEARRGEAAVIHIPRVMTGLNDAAQLASSFKATFAPRPWTR